MNSPRTVDRIREKNQYTQRTKFFVDALRRRKSRQNREQTRSSSDESYLSRKKQKPPNRFMAGRLARTALRLPTNRAVFRDFMMMAPDLVRLPPAPVVANSSAVAIVVAVMISIERMVVAAGSPDLNSNAVGVRGNGRCSN